MTNMLRNERAELRAPAERSFVICLARKALFAKIVGKPRNETKQEKRDSSVGPDAEGRRDQDRLVD